MVRRKRGWMPLKVSKIKEETHDTKTLFFEDAEDGGRQFDYLAGQYLTFRFDNIADKPEVRSYTMSSSPNQKEAVAVTVKEVDDPFVSRHLVRDVKEGDVLKARGPIGKFCYDPDNDEKHLVMVAAGSGVTPFISIMRQYCHNLGQASSPDEMTLIVSYRTKKDLILWQDIEALQKIPGCRVVTSLSREHAEEEGFWYGRITEESLDRLLEGNVAGKTYMTCGPQAMMDMTVGFLKKHGVEDSNIKTESFD